MNEASRKKLEIQEQIANLSDTELILHLKAVAEEVGERYEEAMALMSN